MTKKIVVPYFPTGLKFVTPVLFGVGGYLLIENHPVWAIVLVLSGIIILTTRYVTEIRLAEKVCYDYLSFLGMKVNNDVRKFNHPVKIVIVKENYSQTINTRVQSRQLDWSDYTGRLLFDNAEPLDLLTDTSKRSLLIGLKPFSDFLQVDVEDLTMHEPYFVDMNRLTES